MSNTATTTAGQILPQLATNPQTGQIFMIVPDQQQNGISYFLQRGYVPSQNGLQLQTPFMPQRYVTHHGQHFQLQPNFMPQLPVSSSSSVAASSQIAQSQQIQRQFQQQQQSLQLRTPQQSPQQQASSVQASQKKQRSVQSLACQQTPTRVTTPNIQTSDNSSARIDINEKYISHYIDGQLIFELSKPLVEKKLKSAKKKKKLPPNPQEQSNNLSAAIEQPSRFNHINTHNSIPPSLQGLPAHTVHATTRAHLIQASSPSSQPLNPMHTPTTATSATNIVEIPTTKPVKHVANTENQIQQRLSSTSQSTAQSKPGNHSMTNMKKNKNNNNNDDSDNDSDHISNNKTIAGDGSSGCDNLNSNLNKNGKTPDDISSIRAQMVNWSVDDVVDFIKRHDDISQYSSKFAEDEVDGKALLLMIDRNLNLKILASMFKHGPAMKIEAALSKYTIDGS